MKMDGGRKEPEKTKTGSKKSFLNNIKHFQTLSNIFLMYRICYIILIRTCYFLQDTDDESSDEETIGEWQMLVSILSNTIEHPQT